MTWQRGRAEIERLLSRGELEQVLPGGDVTDRLLADSRAHIVLAGKGIQDDPSGALQLSYDAARKAAAALLAVQGLRSTTRGGHVALIDAVRAQFNDRGGVEVFGRLHSLRRRRHATEYPEVDSPTVNAADAKQALATATAALDAAERLMDSGKLDPFV